MDITNEEALKKGIDFILKRTEKLQTIKITLHKDIYKSFEKEIMELNIDKIGFKKILTVLDVCVGALAIGQGSVNIAPPIENILKMLDYMTVDEILMMYKKSYTNLEPLFKIFENDLTIKEKFILYSSVESIKKDIGIDDYLEPNELRKELSKLKPEDIHKIVRKINILKENLNL